MMGRVMDPGGGDAGNCSVSVHCNDGATISCSGQGGNCHCKADSGWIWSDPGYVQCDNDVKIECSH